MFQIFMLKKSIENWKKSMLKFSACSENCKKTCWKFQHVLKTVMHVEKSVFEISAHIENCNASPKLCWIFQDVLKTCGKFQGMLKTIICVKNYVEAACRKFQHVLKTVTHFERYVKISRCVENVYVRHVENHIENRVEVRNNTITLYGRCWNFSSSILHTFAMWDILGVWIKCALSRDQSLVFRICLHLVSQTAIISAFVLVGLIVAKYSNISYFIITKFNWSFCFLDKIWHICFLNILIM